MQTPAQRECDSFYGNPRGQGGATVSKKWYAENIVLVPAPWKMAMGTIKITRIPISQESGPGSTAGVRPHLGHHDARRDNRRRAGRVFGIVQLPCYARGQRPFDARLWYRHRSRRRPEWPRGPYPASGSFPQGSQRLQGGRCHLGRRLGRRRRYAR